MTESQNKLNKKKVVKEIESKIKNSHAIALAEYRGLTVSQIKEIRIAAKALGVEIKVYKNRLFKIAAKNVKIKDLDSILVGPNIFAFSNNDDLSAAKLLAKFAKENKSFVLKGGTYEGKVIDASGLEVVASLPTYEEALTILARSMMDPLQKISLSLKLISEGKTE